MPSDLATSAQAYIINKRVMQPIIDKLYHFDLLNIPIISIPKPAAEIFKCESSGDCVIPYPIVADVMVYMYGGPTLQFMLPIMNGGNVSSTITESHNFNQWLSFIGIERVLKLSLFQQDNFPSFVRPFVNQRVLEP